MAHIKRGVIRCIQQNRQIALNHPGWQHVQTVHPFCGCHEAAPGYNHFQRMRARLAEAMGGPISAARKAERALAAWRTAAVVTTPSMPCRIASNPHSAGTDKPK